MTARIGTDAQPSERPEGRPASPRDVLRDLDGHGLSNGVIGWVFSVSGPIAITLAVGKAGGLDDAQMESWVFGILLSAGVATLLMSLAYRRPYGFAWSIPGTVLLGPSLQHLSWPEVVGAFFGAGILMVVLGLSGVVRRVMAAVPMPIVMAMVAAIFLRFGTDIVNSSRTDPFIAVPMVVVFVLLSAIKTLGRWVPPVLGALAVGAVMVALSGRFTPGDGPAGQILAAPVFTMPELTFRSQLELVVPLMITVLVVQNGQGVAVLTAAEHKPPVSTFATVSGIFSMVNAAVGAVSACVTGPTNAILTSSGRRERQYAGAVVFGLLSLAAAVVAPGFTRLMLATPEAFILALGGLAMLQALRNSFVIAFSTRYTLGALVTFVVTISGLNLLNIHAAFWGILIGYAVSRLLEPDDYIPAAVRRNGD